VAALAGALDAQLAANAAAEPELAARIREAGIEFVYYQFVTLNGRVMAKVVPARHLARNLERGVQFHGSAVADLATSRHGTLIASGPEREEFLALPDASTLSWSAILGLVEREQEQLAALAAGIDAGRTRSVLPDSERFDLLLGITCHAVYHAGQVQLIKKVKTT